MQFRQPIVAALVMAVAFITLHADVQRPNQRTVSVLALGRDDVPAAGLSIEDFTVREDGVAREVLAVTPTPPPGHIVLLVDDSAIARDYIPALRNALTDFADRFADVQPPPAIRLTTFGDRPTVAADFSSTFSMVSRGIDRIQARPIAGAAFLDALVETSRDLRKRNITGAEIVAFVVEAGPEYSTVSSKMVAEELRRVRATLWTIASQTFADVRSPEMLERAAVVGDVARDSGGRTAVVLSPAQTRTAFERIADQLLSRYAVTYGRPETLVPPSKLEVSVRDRSLKLSVTRWPAE